jgi:hypothetical protein
VLTSHARRRLEAENRHLRSYGPESAPVNANGKRPVSYPYAPFNLGNVRCVLMDTQTSEQLAAVQPALK